MREELTAGGHPRGANACAPHVLLVRVQAEVDVGTPLAAGVDEAERPEGGGLAADMPREQAHSLVPNVAVHHRAGNEPVVVQRRDAEDTQAAAIEITRLHLFVRPKAGPHLELQQRPNDAVVAASFGNDVL